MKENALELLATAENRMFGRVYESGRRTAYWLLGTPQNIASFIMEHRGADRVLVTDMLDLPVVDTIGEFLDHCPDEEFRRQLLKELISMQCGEKEPAECIAATMQEFNDYYNAQMLEMEMM